MLTKLSDKSTREAPHAAYGSQRLVAYFTVQLAMDVLHRQTNTVRQCAQAEPKLFGEKCVGIAIMFVLGAFGVGVHVVCRVMVIREGQREESGFENLPDRHDFLSRERDKSIRLDRGATKGTVASLFSSRKAKR